MNRNLKVWLVAATVLVHCCVCSAYSNDCVLVKLQPVDVSGKVLDTFCVVSLYAKQTGVRLGVEQQGGNRDPARYLIWISEKKSDEDFVCVREKDGPVAAMPFPPFFIGAGETVGSAKNLYLKRGFVPFLWDKHFDGRWAETFTMVEGNSEETVEHLLSGNIDQERVRKLFKQREGTKIVDEFTNEEREKLRYCYYQSKEAIGDK